MEGNSKLKNEEKNQPKKTYPEGNWKRKTSYAMGEYLKIEDEMMMTIRGGKRIQIVKNLAFHVPVIPIGTLDDYGMQLLDAMLEGNDTIMEIVEFFRNYKPTPGLKFNKKAFQEIQAATIEVMEIETESEDDEQIEEDMKEVISDCKPKKEVKVAQQEVKVAKKEVKVTQQEVKVAKKEVKVVKKEVKATPKPKKVKKAKPDKKIIPPNPDYVFDLNDPDFQKIPFIHPDTKKHTFEEWFEILYSVCDPKGLTDDQCVDVMEIRMGGSYLEELKEMKAKKYELYKIELHFLRKDIILDPGYIFNLNDPDFLKIPFMHPDRQKHTFEDWFEILYSVCDPKGLTDDQCVDVMEIRMGGSYLKELKEMKFDNWDLEDIELHFLRKGIEGDEEEEDQDKKLQLVRSSCKDKWGVHMSYSKSSIDGLHLVIDNIKENSPAWKSGLRAMDCIVSVHDWMITLMDQAEVALSLFQACGNIAVLSILKSHGVNEDLSSMGWV